MNESALQKVKQRYDIVGNYDGLNRALDVALQVARTDLSVLITGENGSGKEIFPRLIHDNSLRKGKRYFAVNCGSIPEGTIDSELFGHEKGAFTGAVDSREGYFGAADGGTLFLDEVGELPLSTQARLLRVLETGEYIRVGSSDVRKTNVRIVAATNLNIPKAIAEGRFRQDLYYRLNTIPIAVPPLRERGEDIILLFRKFALLMSEKYNMPPVRLNEEAKQCMMAYKWPGNVRELKNITENMSVTAGEREITPEVLERYLPHNGGQYGLISLKKDSTSHSFENEREILYKILFDLRRDVAELRRQVSDISNGQDRIAPEAMDAEVVDEPEFKQIESEYLEDGVNMFTMSEMERNAIQKALERNHNVRRDAARELGISERTLYRKIKEYDLE